MSRDELATELASMLVAEQQQLSPHQMITLLLDRGLLARREVEKVVARQRVEALCAEGMGRCDAMAEVAHRMCCSYEKIRAFIYQKNEKQDYAIRN